MIHAINLINFSSKATECLIVLISSDETRLIKLYASYRKKKKKHFGGILKITRDVFKYNTGKTWRCYWKTCVTLKVCICNDEWSVKAEFSSSGISKTSCTLPFPDRTFFLEPWAFFLRWRHNVQVPLMHKWNIKMEIILHFHKSSFFSSVVLSFHGTTTTWEKTV